MLIADNQTLILGAPGCGKTTTLLNHLDRHLSLGTPAHRIAYVSFTKKAVNEAIDRAIARFGGKRLDYPYFRTLHSLCLNNVPMAGLKIFDTEHMELFGKFVGVRFSTTMSEEVASLTPGSSREDWCLFTENLARNRLIALHDQFNQERYPPADYHMVEYFAGAYKRFKESNFLIDFTEMLSRYVEIGQPIDVDVAIIDEAQDLSPLQWQVVKKAFKNVSHLYIAGDDDQAIHEWAGADVSTFLQLEGKREILKQSYRIPHMVWLLSQQIISRVHDRFKKEFNSRSEDGVIKRYAMLDMVQVEQLEGSILCLARHKYQLPKLEAMLITAGVVFNRGSGSSSVNKKHVELIIAWERLRNGKTIIGNDVIHLYEAIKGKGAIRHGFKTKLPKEINPLAEYDDADLRKDWGLEATGPWYDVLSGIPEDKKQYYLAVLRKRGQRALFDEPRATVSTIHGAKGGEADHVILLTDVTRRTYEEMSHNPDSEARVFYVAVTRAKKELHIVQPDSIYNFIV